MRSSAVALLLLFPLLGPPTVRAEDMSAGRAEMLQEGQERLIEMFLDHATAELNLSVEQRNQLDVVLRETMERRGDLARNQRQLQRQIREALSNPETADGEFSRLSGEILEVKTQEVQLLEWQEGRLLEVLTPRQTLRFMLLQHQLAQRIEEMRRKRRQ